jgi:hypothetical protein
MPVYVGHANLLSLRKSTSLSTALKQQTRCNRAIEYFRSLLFTILIPAAYRLLFYALALATSLVYPVWCCLNGPPALLLGELNDWRYFISSKE